MARNTTLKSSHNKDFPFVFGHLENRRNPVFFVSDFAYFLLFKPKITMKKILSYALLFLFIGVGATAQTISAAGNNPVPGISKDRIAKIDAMLEESIKASEVPGVVAMVVKDGKIV
jgi:hypothetical protein